MLETPKGLRLHIGLFGRRNSGKSTLMNALVGQPVSIVSDQPGTTTDPVEKPFELAPIGPVVFIDTAGLDDEGALGEQRVKKTRDVMARVGRRAGRNRRSRPHSVRARTPRPTRRSRHATRGGVQQGRPGSARRGPRSMSLRAPAFRRSLPRRRTAPVSAPSRKRCFDSPPMPVSKTPVWSAT